MEETEGPALNVTVYSPSDPCSLCMGTKARLRGYRIDFVAKTVSDEDIEKFRSDGFSSFPVVVVHRDDGSIDSWCGFNNAKLEELRSGVAR